VIYSDTDLPRADKRPEKDRLRKEIEKDVENYLRSGGTIKVFNNGEQVAETSLQTFDKRFIHNGRGEE
jgi:hypothetical protein